MNGPIKLLKAIIILGLVLGAAGLLSKATYLIGKEAIKTNQRGGIKFKDLNKTLSK